MAKIEPPTSYIQVGTDGSTMFVGELATKLYQAMQVRACIAAPLGPASTRKTLVVAQAFTGRRYLPTDELAATRLRAIADLDDWIAAMELLVPILEETP